MYSGDTAYCIGSYSQLTPISPQHEDPYPTWPLFSLDTILCLHWQMPNLLSVTPGDRSNSWDWDKNLVGMAWGQRLEAIKSELIRQNERCAGQRWRKCAPSWGHSIKPQDRPCACWWRQVPIGPAGLTVIILQPTPIPPTKCTVQVGLIKQTIWRYTFYIMLDGLPPRPIAQNNTAANSDVISAPTTNAHHLNPFHAESIFLVIVHQMLDWL